MSDSDSDNQPLALLKKKAKPANGDAGKGRAPAKREPTTAAKSSGGARAKPKPKPKPKSKATDEEDDDDDESGSDGVFQSGAKGGRKSKKGKDAGSSEDSASDDGDFEPRKKKAAAASKKRARPASSDSDGGGDNSDDGSDAKPAKGKGKGKRAAAAAAAKKKAAPRAPRGSSGSAAVAPARKRAATGAKEPQKFKDMTRMEKIEHALKAYKWWEEAPLEDGKQWNHIEHNGVNFSAEYEPHGVKMLYDGTPLVLTAEEEEVASFYANVPEDGPQLKEADTAKTFRKNFFSDWRELLGKGHEVQSFSKCDFRPIKEHLDQQKLAKKSRTDGERATAKGEKETLLFTYGFAIVDDHLERVGNTTIEPPGLFRGRGKHPLMGRLKKRVYPDQVTLNVGEGARVPQCPVPGFAWEGVQHDPTVTWLANWKENVLGANKYVMLAANSSFKGKSDMEKYNKAMKLKGYIAKIREDYEQKLRAAGDRATRQIATAVWIIDKLALRVGGEKGEDEADTVGCCSLRVEHLTFSEAEGAHEIELEFLGKDSMLFKQNIDFDKYGEVGRTVFKNLKSFCKNKRKAEDVFEDLTPTLLNQHLQSLMPGLSAKVFRTYNASDTLQNELPDEAKMRGMTLQEKVVEYNKANREVAILCNHQRTVSNAQIANLENTQGRLDTLKAQRKELKTMKDALKDKKGKGVRLKSGDTQLEEDAAAAVAAAAAARGGAQTDAERIAAAAATEAASKKKREAAKRKFEDAHLFAKTPSAEQVEARVKQWTEKIRKLEVDIRDKEDNKEVALGTSKKNYMDPRISVAWCKRHEVPVEKIFPKTLRDQFVWSMNVPPDWQFSYETLLEMQKSKKGQAPHKVKDTPAAKRVRIDKEEEDDDEGGAALGSGGGGGGSSGGKVKAEPVAKGVKMRDEEPVVNGCGGGGGGASSSNGSGGSSSNGAAGRKPKARDEDSDDEGGTSDDGDKKGKAAAKPKAKPPPKKAVAGKKRKASEESSDEEEDEAESSADEENSSSGDGGDGSEGGAESDDDSD